LAVNSPVEGGNGQGLNPSGTKKGCSSKHMWKERLAVNSPVEGGNGQGLNPGGTKKGCSSKHMWKCGDLGFRG
jgi:hypothetical protein